MLLPLAFGAVVGHDPPARRAGRQRFQARSRVFSYAMSAGGRTPSLVVGRSSGRAAGRADVLARQAAYSIGGGEGDSVKCD